MAGEKVTAERGECDFGDEPPILRLSARCESSLLIFDGLEVHFAEPVDDIGSVLLEEVQNRLARIATELTEQCSTEDELITKPVTICGWCCCKDKLFDSVLFGLVRDISSADEVFLAGLFKEFSITPKGIGSSSALAVEVEPIFLA